jgi:hypothetical protein
MEDDVTVSIFIQQLRQLVLEHPDAAQREIVICPHGTGHRQHIREVHLNEHGVKVVVEAER